MLSYRVKTENGFDQYNLTDQAARSFLKGSAILRGMVVRYDSRANILTLLQQKEYTGLMRRYVSRAINDLLNGSVVRGDINSDIVSALLKL